MTETIKREDAALEAVLQQFGSNSRVALAKLKDAIDEYVGIDFQTNKAKAEDITKSFEGLHRIYTLVLGTPIEHSNAAMSYLIRRFSEGRYGAFSVIRTNMSPPVEIGGNKNSMRFVADMNQLIGNLATVSTATQLAEKMKLSPVLANVRSESHRDVIQSYIASIDF